MKFSRTGRGAAAAASVLSIGLSANLARANPEPLPFTYVAETLEKGQLEIEQYIDFVPTKAESVTTGQAVTYAATQFQTELEYGLTNRLELGLYAVIVPSASPDEYELAPVMPEGNGLKERLKYRFTDVGAPLDVSGYLELVESLREIEIESKIIVQKRFGPVRAIVNAWAEREQYFDNHGEWVIHPTAGITYQATYVVNPGIETWMEAEFQDKPQVPRPFALGPHVYVGPTMMLSFAKLWWTTGMYFRVTDVTRPLQEGDVYGKLWLRAVVGLPF